MRWANPIDYLKSNPGRKLRGARLGLQKGETFDTAVLREFREFLYSTPSVRTAALRTPVQEFAEISLRAFDALVPFRKYVIHPEIHLELRNTAIEFAKEVRGIRRQARPPSVIEFDEPAHPTSRRGVIDAGFAQPAPPTSRRGVIDAGFAQPAPPISPSVIIDAEFDDPPLPTLRRPIGLPPAPRPFGLLPVRPRPVAFAPGVIDAGFGDDEDDL